MTTVPTAGPDEPRCLLAPDGTLADGHVPALDDDALLDAWRAMLRSRVADERCFSLQRQGRLGTFSPVDGEEAAVVGSAWALDPARDWVVPQYRELPAMLRQGYPLRHAHAVLPRRPRRRARPGGRPGAALPDLAGGPDPARGRAGLGPAPPGLRRRRLRVLRRRRVLGGGRPRGAEPRRRAARAGRLPAEEQRLGDLDAGAQADGGCQLRRPRGGLRDPGRARRRQRPLRRPRRLHARRRPGAGGRRADADRGPHLPDGTAQHLRRPDPVRRPGRARGAPRERPGRARPPAPRPRVGCADEAAEERLVDELREEVDAAFAAAEAAPAAGPAALFDHVYADPPDRLRRQRAAATGEGA